MADDLTETITGKHPGCIYCEHGPYCLACPPPQVTEGPVCRRCREEITRSEIAADPWYRGGDAGMS